MNAYLMVYLNGLLFTLALISLMWLLSLLMRDASIIDIFWGLGFILLCGFYFFSTEGYNPRKWLIFAMALFWGCRLSLHILLRNRGKGEDYRYRKWREEAGQAFWWQSFFRVFLLQGIILWLVSAPLLAAQASSQPNHFTGLDVAGVIIWLAGFLFESIGDYQLARFKRNPSNRGKVMRSGLWRYTRHPNYFGDSLVWWGFFLVATATPVGLFTLFSPVLMTFLLVRISGVRLLEQSLMHKKPEYLDYTKNTSPFFPWFPRDKS